MLSEYIQSYIIASKERDIRKMKRIEAELAKLGMDRRTLLAVASEIASETIGPDKEA